MTKVWEGMLYVICSNSVSSIFPSGNVCVCESFCFLFVFIVLFKSLQSNLRNMQYEFPGIKNPLLPCTAHCLIKILFLIVINCTLWPLWTCCGRDTECFIVFVLLVFFFLFPLLIFCCMQTRWCHRLIASAHMHIFFLWS